MEYIIAACSDIGIKKKTNQDALSARVFNINGEKAVFAVLCDGMGGLSQGEIISATLVEAFTNWLVSAIESSALVDINIENIVKMWNKVIASENKKIVEFGKKLNQSVGSTIVVFLMKGTDYYIMNIGDSRAYMISSGIKQITHDHSFVYEEIKAGRMTAEEAEKDPRRNVLLQSIGVTEDIKPEYYYGKISKDTCFLLCSDGLVHKVTSEEIRDALSPSVCINKFSMQASLGKLIETVKERNETDNISGVIIKSIQNN